MYSSGTPNGKPRTPYHEFYADDFTPRDHYRLLWDHIKATGNSALEAKAHESQLALQAEGGRPASRLRWRGSCMEGCTASAGTLV